MKSIAAGLGDTAFLPQGAIAKRPYTIIAVAAFVLVPIVLVYQIWTYYIFRKRLQYDTLQEGKMRK